MKPPEAVTLLSGYVIVILFFGAAALLLAFFGGVPCAAAGATKEIIRVTNNRSAVWERQSFGLENFAIGVWVK
jgi:hypothetical protein